MKVSQNTWSERELMCTGSQLIIRQRQQGVVRLAICVILILIVGCHANHIVDVLDGQKRVHFPCSDRLDTYLIVLLLIFLGMLILVPNLISCKAAHMYWFFQGLWCLWQLTCRLNPWRTWRCLSPWQSMLKLESRSWSRLARGPNLEQAIYSLLWRRNLSSSDHHGKPTTAFMSSQSWSKITGLHNKWD